MALGSDEAHTASFLQQARQEHSSSQRQTRRPARGRGNPRRDDRPNLGHERPGGSDPFPTPEVPRPTFGNPSAPLSQASGPALDLETQAGQGNTSAAGGGNAQQGPRIPAGPIRFGQGPPPNQMPMPTGYSHPPPGFSGPPPGYSAPSQGYWNPHEGHHSMARGGRGHHQDLNPNARAFAPTWQQQQFQETYQAPYQDTYQRPSSSRQWYAASPYTTMPKHPPGVHFCLAGDHITNTTVGAMTCSFAIRSLDRCLRHHFSALDALCYLFSAVHLALPCILL